MMPLRLISFSHHCAPIAVREQLRPSLEELGGLLVAEAEIYLLLTCNRSELYFCGLELDTVLRQLSRLSGLDEASLRDHSCFYEGEAACRHLFKVVAGLDSQVLGETQINAQAKAAYRTAAHYGATGLYLNKALHRAFACAKRVHTETAIGRYPVSLASAAVELAGRIFGHLAKHPALIIGAGEMAELAARRLRDRGVRELAILNRSVANACGLADELGARAGSLTALAAELERSDIVIAAATVDETLIEAALLEAVMLRRRHRPLLIVDIGLPRNVAPTRLYNCYLYDLDALGRSIDANRTSRVQELERAAAIVDEEVAAYAAWCAGLHASPTIAELYELNEVLIAEQLDASHLSGAERAALEAALRKFARRLSHRPISFLRENPEIQNTEILRRIFRLDEDYQDRFARQRACPGSGRDR